MSLHNDDILILSDIAEYLIELKNVHSDYPKEGKNHRFLYRGQKEEVDSVCASIFREDEFSMEREFITEAYMRRPSLLQESSSHFERLTKLQHYGLKTRLLDLSLNPLVALYFACEDALYKDADTLKDGVVYIYSADCFSYDSKEIKIHSAIIEMDVHDMEISELAQELKEMGILSSRDIREYEKYNYLQLKSILNDNYFILPSLTNERLIRQSGAFYLPGCITISTKTSFVGGDKKTCEVINKSVDNESKQEINDYVIKTFKIKAENKKRILMDLDNYNINTASLFPELEYQMKYVIYTNNLYKKQTNAETIDKYIHHDYSLANPEVDIQNQVSEDGYNNNSYVVKLDDYLSTISKNITYNSSIISDIQKIIDQSMVVDWYKREKPISQVKANLKRYLSSSLSISKEENEELVENIINYYKSYVKEKSEPTKDGD